MGFEGEGRVVVGERVRGLVCLGFVVLGVVIFEDCGLFGEFE